MKKLLSTVLALLLMLSLSVPAFAEVYVDGDPKGTGEVTVDGDAGYVKADATGDDLTVNGKVAGDDSAQDSVYAVGSAKITVSGSVTEEGKYYAVRANTGGDVTVKKDVTESGDGDAINASSGAVVEVGNVSEDGKGNAVSASSGASVTVEGNVTESGEGFAVNASGAETIVTVNGNVDESGTGSALQAVEATIIVIGNVEEKNAGSAITALKNATVIVGGNVTDGVETAGASDAVSSGYDATVIVEGLVTGQLSTNGQTNSGTIYLGKLNGGIKGDADLNKIHYLIGTADGQNNNNINVIGTIVSTDTIDGVKNKGYYYTTTADCTVLSGQSFNIKSTDSNKKIKINETYDGVTIVNNPNGTITLTIGENFKGGIQALNVIFEDIAREISSDDDSYKPIFTGSKGNPVTNGKWRRNADGTWTYATVYKFSNTWGYIANPNDANSAAWYYFDRNGNMLTGWQKLYWNGVQKWYYFSQTKDSNEGKCLVDCITPDGYKVGPDGAWIED